MQYLYLIVAVLVISVALYLVTQNKKDAYVAPTPISQEDMRRISSRPNVPTSIWDAQNPIVSQQTEDGEIAGGAGGGGSASDLPVEYEPVVQTSPSARGALVGFPRAMAPAGVQQQIQSM